MRHFIACAFIVAAPAFSSVFLACGSSGSAGPGSEDSGTFVDAEVADVGVDAGYPAGDPNKYPAFAPAMPAVVNRMGAVLSQPKIVTVTWSTDPIAYQLTQFGDQIGTSDFWKALTEYGIGTATSGPTYHVSIPDAPPAIISDTDLDTFIGAHVAAAPGNGWPAWDAQTMYIVYLPQTTMLTSMGEDACDLEDGYHDETQSGSLQHIVYGVIVQSCAAGDATVLDVETENASHEMVEAATDPHTQTDEAWSGMSRNDYAWDTWLEQQDEVADACENFDLVDIYETDPQFPFSIQRFWSNAAAAAGKNPCVPHAVSPYYNVTPLDLGTIRITNNGEKFSSRGFHISAGQTATIHLGFYSDAPTEAWRLGVVEGDGNTKVSPSRLTLSLDKTSGVNGDVATLTVTVKSADPKVPFSLVTAITSGNSRPERFMPFIIETD